VEADKGSRPKKPISGVPESGPPALMEPPSLFCSAAALKVEETLGSPEADKDSSGA